MKINLHFFIFLLVTGVSQAETFSECILENMKGVGSDRAALQVRAACKQKVLPYVPGACKAQPLPSHYDENGKRIAPFYRNPFDQFDPEIAREKACIDKCLEASWWDKKFGDCKP